MAYSGGSAAASSYGVRVDLTAKEMAKAVLAVINSEHFDKDEIREQKLTLSQAFCLLWQDPESGDVDGRKVSVETNGGAAAAVLLDLVVLGKGEVELVPNKTLGIKNDLIVFKVLSDKPTETYLDAAMFDSILKHHSKHPDKPEKVKHWIYEDITHMKARNLCSTITLDSLVEMGVLDMKEKFIGRKYPTVKPGVEENLVRDIRAVALDGVQPSSYIRALLTLARAADDLLCLSDPVLKKHFSKGEYDKAKERIIALVGIDKKSKEKYEAV
ncbi:uncharacterized protein LOC116295502 [Actinia tenebrosa]|uniref:Uncharacterized protein LOC116295502 n=1 Tax=Actinia tenebrosa TaxID=6105 RepID=A0A6P8HV56_ACTTE|nr:uncharacterized protein LOC116295502 [Actinia tenebrosa]